MTATLVANEPTRVRRVPRVFIFRALLALSVVWLLFALAQVLLSDRVWWWFAGDFVPPVAYPLIPLAIAGVSVPCRRSRRPVALICLASLGLGVSLAGFNFAGVLTGGSGVAPPGAITVVAWNTEYWDQHDDPTAFFGFLQAQHADVYVLQEYMHADDNDQPVRIDDGARVRAAFPGYDIAISGELITISRYRIVAWKALDAPGMPAPETSFTDFWLRKVLRTDISAGGKLISVYNTHLPVSAWIGGPGIFDAEFYQAIRDQHAMREPQLKALANDVAANRNPVVVTGDLNTSPAMGDTRNFPSGLRDAISASDSFYPVSWMDRWVIPEWWRLDWTLVSSALTVHQYEFLGAQGMSDHRLQRLVISL